MLNGTGSLEPERRNGNEDVARKIKIEGIASNYLDRFITDDNPSTKNGYTALDQLIIYDFDLASFDNDEFFNQFQELKDLVMDRIHEIINEEEDDPIDNECEGEDWEYFEAVDLFDEDRVLTKIARYILLGYITDDVLSPFSGVSSLEQIIAYEYGEMINANNNVREMARIRKKLLAIKLDMKGGGKIYRNGSLDEFTDLNL